MTFVPVAIVAAGCNFPKASDLASFWENIVQGVDGCQTVPSERWVLDPQWAHQREVSDQVKSLRAGVIDHPLEIPPTSRLHGELQRSLQEQDPLYRLAIATAHQALDGVRGGIDLTQTGVVLASIALPTEFTGKITTRFFSDQIASQIEGQKPLAPPQVSPENRQVVGLPAALVAASTGAQGGAYTLDAACASALYAIELACQELIAGRQKAMICGGVSRPDCLYTQMGFSALSALSSSGYCRPFDKRGDGLVVGEGAGIFVLKLLEDALEQGDEVLGVIRGIGLSNDIQGNLLAPDNEGQMRALTYAYQQSGWHPSQVDFVECHGTGTKMGDKVEFNSLNSFWNQHDAQESRCAIGSIKSMIGHLLTGAGAAGMAKTLLGLKHHQIPPSLHFEEAGPGIDLENSPFSVPTQPSDWDRPSEHPRRAGVSAFGFGGINAHVLVEEFDQEYHSQLVEESSTLPSKEAVAIVGIEMEVGRYEREEVLQALLSGEALVTSKPQDRWGSHQEYFPHDLAQPSGCYFDEIVLEIGKQKISPKDIPETLIQQLLLVKLANRALLQTKLSKDKATRASALVGINLDFNTTTFHLRWQLDQLLEEWGWDPKDPASETLREQICPVLNATRTLGNLGSIAASRMARELGFGGPSFAISGDETSGIRALEVALRQLQRGDIECAVVGAYEATGDPRLVQLVEKQRAFSQQATSQPFQAQADGPTLGEGGVVLVLKRLSDARKDQDTIYATIEGLSTQISSAKVEQKTYLKALTLACEEAQLTPQKLDLWLAHASGDPREDRIEALTMQEVLGKSQHPCALSSSTPITGWLGAANGLMNLAKAALHLGSRQMSGLPSWQEPKSPLPQGIYLAPLRGYWYTPSPARHALVSTIGLDGNCSQVILKQPEELVSLPPALPQYLYLLTATDRDGLMMQLEAHLQDLEENPSLWSEMAQESLECANTPSAWRLCLTFTNFDELLAGLKGAHRDLMHPQSKGQGQGFFHNRGLPTFEGKVAMVYPGSGGLKLAQKQQLSSFFCEVWSELDEGQQLWTQYRPQAALPLAQNHSREAQKEQLEKLYSDPHNLIFNQVSYGILHYRCWQQFCSLQEGSLGYSLGETTSLFAHGAWNDRQQMFQDTIDSQLFSHHFGGPHLAASHFLGLPEASYPWGAVLLQADQEEVRKHLKSFSQLWLTLANTPNECIVGGNQLQIQQFLEESRLKGIPLKGIPSVHWEGTTHLVPQYRELHCRETSPVENFVFYNNVHGQSYQADREVAANSLTSQVNRGFAYSTMVEQAYQDGFRYFFEVGPGGTCTRMIRKILAGKTHLALTLSPKSESPMQAMLEALGKLFVMGKTPLNLHKFARFYPVVKAQNPRLRIAVKPSDYLPGSGPALQFSKSKKPPRPKVELASSSPTSPTTAQTKSSPVAHQTSVIASSSPKVQLASTAPSAPVIPLTTEKESIAKEKSSSSVSQESSHSRDLSLASEQANLEPQGVTPQPEPEPTKPYQRERSPFPEPQSFVKASSRTTLLKHEETVPAPAREVAQVSGSTFPWQNAGTPRLHWNRQPSQAPWSRSWSSPTFTQKESPFMNPMEQQTLQAVNQTTLAHEKFLLHQQQLMQTLGALSGQVAPQSPQVAPQPPQVAPRANHIPSQPPQATPPVQQEQTTRAIGPMAHQGPVAFDRDLCMEFAIGSIAKVLGPKFAEVDSYDVRVRLPDDPLMLVDRIVSVTGEAGSMGTGSLITEHDVLPDAWYLDAGRTPVFVSVEAGQADLFLSSYLGIDLQVKGTRAYRLLDAKVKFHRGLPQAGETIRYDIRILNWARQGDVYLFFFEYEGTINGEPLITMREGCAGFFTDEEIENSGGIILTPEELKETPGKWDTNWRDLTSYQGKESYDDQRVEAFRQGDLVACFGPEFANLPLTKPYSLPSGRLHLFDRILELDQKGGRFGCGTITAEADIHPDDWFLTCHFVDDMVMPGTLMYECCAHTLRFLLARIGWVGEESIVAFEPVQDHFAVLKCRGPVDTETKKVTYQVDIKEIGYHPEPYVIADALMFRDGKAIVRFVDMSMQLTGLTRESVESLWSPPVSKVLYDKQSIMEFSNGKPSLAFGDPYQVFDQERRIARLPGPPYQFMDRVVEVDHPPFKLQAGGWVEAQWDIKPDDWYFFANHQTSMAYCILLEAALQPCGWLAAYAGSALHSDEDLHFRNLGGTATLTQELMPDTGTLRMRTRMTKVSHAAGMIIQDFDMEMYVGDTMIYQGDTNFGFFTSKALAQQIGIRDAKDRLYEADEKVLEKALKRPLTPCEPLVPQDGTPPHNEGLALPGKALLMLDQIDALSLTDGPFEQGFAIGSKTIDPEEWFFKAHFYQDPVWPGSLGLEGVVQLMKAWAQERWPEKVETHRFEPVALGRKHSWIYRGQVIPSNRLVHMHAYITKVEEGDEPVLTANGFLIVDGLPIYEMTDFSLRMVRQ